ncbi:MAG: hypothetical protein Q7K13_06160 [Polynucleobacter sp.]|uniref:hypothetical protein n=1 Tax=Polynucleobacter sp. TaxID=2029855 RepID=UPI00271726F0|nr:hypothetical protein [Polynucleobacter sp.]MDO8714047.1 hypothetical protein [Polynucleobacter sp.]
MSIQAVLLAQLWLMMDELGQRWAHLGSSVADLRGYVRLRRTFDPGDLVSVLTDSDVSGYATVGRLLRVVLRTLKTG